MKIKDKVASNLGCVLEWYDFALYGFFAPLIAELYFPNSSLSNGLLKAFSVFAIGFIARPFGALIFGYISDKYGRTVSLKVTPLLIMMPTLLLSILPTYHQIGIVAPVLLIILRICQGICIGGEFANNIIYLCESSSSKHRYFLGSIGACSGSLGILLASIVALSCYSAFSKPTLLLFGWRIAFAISLIIGLATYAMRRNIKEPPVFQKLYETSEIATNPILYSYQSQRKNYLFALGISFLPATAFYYVFMFMPSYLSKILKMNVIEILGDNALSLAARILIIPLIGLLADIIGGMKIAMIASILFLTLSLPLFYSVTNGYSYFVFCLYGFALLTTLTAASLPGILISILNPKTRSTTFSFTFNISYGAFGGTAPLIGFSLANKFDNKIAPIYYLIFSSLVTLITLIILKKNKLYEKY